MCLSHEIQSHIHMVFYRESRVCFSVMKKIWHRFKGASHMFLSIEYWHFGTDIGLLQFVNTSYMIIRNDEFMSCCYSHAVGADEMDL